MLWTNSRNSKNIYRVIHKVRTLEGGGGDVNIVIDDKD